MKKAKGALPCPFCGAQPSVEPWHGGKPTKKMISCDCDKCPVGPQTTGETLSEAIAAWNTRA